MQINIDSQSSSKQVAVLSSDSIFCFKSEDEKKNVLILRFL